MVVWDCAGDGPADSTPLAFELHAKPLSAVAFQHRGPVLASAAPDGKVALWYPGGSKKVQATADFGEGVSCHVFRAWDESKQCPVAMKIVNWGNVYDRAAALKQMRTASSMTK